MRKCVNSSDSQLRVDYRRPQTGASEGRRTFYCQFAPQQREDGVEHLIREHLRRAASAILVRALGAPEIGGRRPELETAELAGEEREPVQLSVAGGVDLHDDAVVLRVRHGHESFF